MSADLPLAGRGRRFAATLIDVLLVPLLAILLMLVTGVLEHAQDWSASGRPVMRMLALGVASYVILNLWLLWSRGQTAGKAILGIRIVSTKTGEKPAFWRLFIRGLFFPTLYLIVSPYTAIVPLADQAFIFGRQRRCLHDRICGTSVVKRGAGATQSAPGT
jgi:uncharacterized RDD family membrane protein YckC